MSDLGVLGDATTSSIARGVNNHGMVVGDTGILYTGSNLHPDPDLFSQSLKSPNGVGFIYMNGKMFDLNTLIDPNSGFTIVRATGINDNGQIVGYGKDTSFKVGSNDYTSGYHALLLTPVVTEQPTSSPLTVPITQVDGHQRDERHSGLPGDGECNSSGSQ